MSFVLFSIILIAFYYVVGVLLLDHLETELKNAAIFKEAHKHNSLWILTTWPMTAWACQKQ